ncbi:MAG: primosomal protein N' [Spirochaetaceae bacterium]
MGGSEKTQKTHRWWRVVEAHKYLELVFNLPLDGPFTYVPSEKVDAEVGMRVVAPFGRRKLTGFVVGVHTTPPKGDFKIRAIERRVDTEPIFGAEEVELARWIAGMYFCTLGEALSSMLPGGKRVSETPSFPVEEEVSEGAKTLSMHQERALRKLVDSEGGRFYLYGVTGSGKTEVFLQAAEETIRRGFSVIYLVPEISLTHQLVKVVRTRFADTAALWHSRLTPSQKLGEWNKIRRGEAKLVVGARSAVSTPVQNLGLIIIDEEHESSYKSGQTPRYHARQIAMKRCSDGKATLVMGSATPSVEAVHLMREGKIVRLDLPERIAGGTLPHIEVVQMDGRSGALSDRLAEEIQRTHTRGGQTILFLNRRGFSYFFHCRSCGYEMKCRHCSVSLTYHKSRGKMICHYCGYRRDPVEVCPECGSLDVGYSGFGTERIEEETARRFPHLSIARVDTDSVKKKGSLEKTLNDFRDGKIDILLGTQMVAKGLNFPGVKLVGIVLADSTLNVPDFRSPERTFSLIVQVSGRAGRYTDDGRVIIQTFKPGVPAIADAAAGEHERYYTDELAMRKELGFPPYNRLFRIVFRGGEREKVKKRAEAAATALRSYYLEDTEILGPASCPVEVIAGNIRYHIIIRTLRYADVHRMLRRWYHEEKEEKGTYREIDPDPVSLL